MSQKTRLSELVFIPSPGRGHLMSAIEMAKLLVQTDKRLSVTVFVIKPYDSSTNSTIFSSYSDQKLDSRIRFVDLPKAEPLEIPTNDPISFINNFIASHKDHVREAMKKIVEDPDSNSSLVGFVVDMFCTSMIDVANEFGVPSYVFFTSGAAALGLLFHFQSQRDETKQDLSVYAESDLEVSIPSYENPVPAKLLPTNMFAGGNENMLLNHAKRFRESKGILINTFFEFESFAIRSLLDDKRIPPVYPIGPILHSSPEDEVDNPKYKEIMKWLDEQPDHSVVFLCFGSQGCFDENQIKEIANALEQSGHRFLWSLRKPPSSKHEFEIPGEYKDPKEVLPEGFLERTSGIGKVIGWAPQVTVLSHQSVGGFVSHCGWNSTLESVWNGVPMAAWPLYAEQQVNAFQLVKDLGVAVEIKMDYKQGGDVLVTADEIENGIRCLMEDGTNEMMAFNEVKVKSRGAMVDGGSSLNFLECFVDSFIENVS